MSCDLDRETLCGEQSLVTGGGRTRAEVNKGTLGAAEVSRGRVEDGVVLGEARCPAPGVGEGALVELGSLEDRTGEDSGGRGLFRCWGTRVQIGEAAGQGTRSAFVKGRVGGEVSRSVGGRQQIGMEGMESMESNLAW